MDERKYARQSADGRPKKTTTQPPSGSSSSNNNNNNKQQQSKFSRWSSGSKINKILNNIERSILAQFNGNPSSSASDTPNDGQSMTNSSPTKTKSAMMATKSANKLPRQSGHNSDATHPNQMDRVTLELKSDGSKELPTANSQLMPANRNGKMILNKYQQQIVSAMQTNKNRPVAGKNSGANSNYSHNRLSIPPPHANDEARNQNHRLLFGCPRTQTSDFNSPTKDQMAPTYEHGRSIKQNTVDHQPALFYHSSASPASSAQSLPVTKPGFLQAPQNRSRINATGHEEAGFCTYQSHRSALNDPPSTNRISNDFGKPENNMTFMQANQVPLINIGSNNLAPHQQQMIQQNLLQSRIAQQNNTQQQQLNQVPISQGVMYNSNLHIQHQMNSHQQQQSANRLGDNRNQTYGSYGHLGPAMTSQVSMQQQQQQYPPQPLYDGQIYANAPPKPRRYQYYDPNFTINPHLMATNRASHNYPPPNSTQFIGQQINGAVGRQFSYNIPDDRAQAYSQGELMNGTQIPYRPQRQLPMLPPPPTLTKSKSSLDVAELTRFKQDRIHADGMLRVQPHSSNVPIYGSTRYINQLESSTLQRNSNYHPQIAINYQQQRQQQQQQQQQPPPTNLQRSKSIGNLLPDYKTHGLNMTQRQLEPFPTSDLLQQQQQSVAPAYPKFLTVSSASTNNLNYVGLANNNTSMLMNNCMPQSRQANHTVQHTSRLNYNNVNNPVQNQHQQRRFHIAQNAPLAPMRQSYQRTANSSVCWPDQQQTKTTAYNNVDGEVTKTDTNTISNSGKIVRQSHNGNIGSNGVPLTEASGSVVAQSLDDKIRHLLIGNDSTSSEGASNNKTESREAAAAWPVQQQSQLQISRQTESSQKEAGTRPTPKSITGRQQDPTRSNNSEYDESLVGEQIYQTDEASTSMGNRHQRQYEVGGPSKGTQDQQMRVGQRQAGNHCDGMSINSQLIVDLTTPRVLAKTQTTLQPTTSFSDQASRPQQFLPREAWSMNQLGLPTSYVDQFALNAQSDISNQEQNLESVNKFVATDASNFPAPYYYSDLKSEEQRRALFNIVQQKSLSPPPQLLSRSYDQGNTRLAPKSATMHAGQARMLSETLAASQRRLQTKGPNQDSKSTNNIPGVSSNCNVAKNIDKLFESPVDPQLGQSVANKLHSVQSMLVLSSDPDGEDSCSAKSRAPSDQNRVESLSNSSGYCSDALKKAVSKSKSLENISQQQLLSNGADGSIDKSTIEEKVRRYGNPVYENIRRSDKLLSAINNSTTCLSTSSTRNRNARSSLPAARAQPTSGSDSMDSILGSSFDDDQDNSDENPDDIDSDNSTNGIDFIKLSPTTADMSELIEQLKNNHAKLTDEYKSTLARISKILNRKDSSGKRKISDKLAGRLQQLEHKSKKCESRSKNQLALIQMMEKAFRQTKQGSSVQDDARNQPEVDKSHEHASGDGQVPDTSESRDSPQNSISLKQTSLSCVNTSPCQSIDYQNFKQKTQTATETNPSQQANVAPPPPSPPPPPVFEAQNVIKTIVTEATSAEIPRKFVAELCKQSKPTGQLSTKTIDSDSLSTRHHQGKNQDRNNKDNSKQISNGTVGQRIQSIESIVKRTNNKNPFQTDKPEDDAVAAISEDKATVVKQKSSTGAFDELGDDEDDFIEFLSTGSNSTHGRSQYESSQFSASDFNNSSSSGSTSESSHSGSVTTDSLDISSPSSKSGKPPIKNAGILKGGSKSSKAEDKSVMKRQSNRNINNNDDNDSINNRDEKATRGENKFKNVLGNVIDVDVYPVNMDPPSSRCSPVGNK